MEYLMILTGALLLFIAFPTSIIIAIVFAVKKRNIKVPLICIFVSFVLSLYILVGVFAFYPTEESAKNENQKEDMQNAKQENPIENPERELAEPTEEEIEKAETEKNEKGTEERKQQEEEPREEPFLKDLKTVLDEQVAEKSYDILKNQIGFSELKYEGRLDETTNWKIAADGVSIILTASDEVYRVFIPNTSYVFYEDGGVKLTAGEYLNTAISWEDEGQYYIIAKTIIEDCVTGKSKFPSNPTGMERNGGLVVVQGTVQGQNSFGATVEEIWTVEFLVYDLDSWSYEPVYIKLGDSTVGEFIKLEDWEE